MRVLLISTMFGHDSWGGSEEMWRSIADAAMDAGHDVTVSVRRRPGAMPKQVLDPRARGATVLQRHDWYGRRGRLRGHRSDRKRRSGNVIGSGPTEFSSHSHPATSDLASRVVPRLSLVQAELALASHIVTLGRVLDPAREPPSARRDAVSTGLFIVS